MISRSSTPIRFALLLAAIAGAVSSIRAEVPASPNVLIIYADDLGYEDVQCYNQDRGKIPTPNIDRLAREGMRFTDAHSSSGVCSPSRYTLLTGRYHWRTRLQRGIVGLWGLPVIAPDRLTVGSLAKRQGYQTACIGKWHLGWDWPIANDDQAYLNRAPRQGAVVTPEHQAAWRRTFQRPIGGGPIARGFDAYHGTDVPNWPPFCFIENDRTVGIPTVYLPDPLFQNNQASVQGPALEGWTLEPILPELGSRTVDFLRRASEDPDRKPFLVYMSLTSPHTPLAVNREWLGKSGHGLYADFVMETDAVVGQVLAALDALDLAEETLVLFTSDNGCAPYIGVKDLEAQGHFPSGPLRGYKSDVWEGGHRVPFIARWPGVVGAGSECHQLVHQADWLATLAAVWQVDLPADSGEDSFSLLPLLAGEDRSVRRHAVSCSIRGLPSFRDGHWKLILGKGSGGWTEGSDEHPVQLYNLSTDLGETTNLAGQATERVREMTRLYRQLVANGRSTRGPEQPNDVDVVLYPLDDAGP